ncbi:MAG: hydroxymethylbilane synthase [Chloroflexi bacterium]|nr:hydroxymethylbilane synthase [Chloroflexota bacterium]
MIQIKNQKSKIENRALVVGTRGSALARWQTEFVITALLRRAPGARIELRIIKTAGDKDQARPLAEFGGLGVFTQELEHALRDGEVDVAVHSLKDLPTDSPAQLTVAAYLPRQDARDAIVSRHNVGLKQLPRGARIGTSSARRTAQILALRPDAKIIPLRGNVDTRLRKAQTEAYDAIVIAAAGLIRLGRAHEITEYLSLDRMLPDPGQGALAAQIRADDDELARLLAPLDDAPTRAAVTAERAFLHALGGGCRTPMGAYAEPCAEGLRVRGMVGALDGAQIVRGEIRGDLNDAEQLGQALAKQLLENGAAKILHPTRLVNTCHIERSEDIGDELHRNSARYDSAPLTQSARAGALANKRIVITRAHEQANELAEKIRARGGVPFEFPTIEFAPLQDYSALDDALARIREFDWVVFTSANGVRAVAERVGALNAITAVFENVRVAAIGPGTARALEQIGVRADFIPTKFLGEQVARELPVSNGQRVLLLRADIASDVLADVLKTRDVNVLDIDAYRTVRANARSLDWNAVDAVTFTSSSTVRNLMALLDDDARAQLRTRDIFCIGPVTADAARDLGLNISAVADEHTLDGLVAAMVKFYGGN